MTYISLEIHRYLPNHAAMDVIEAVLLMWALLSVAAALLVGAAAGQLSHRL